MFHDDQNLAPTDGYSSVMRPFAHKITLIVDNGGGSPPQLEHSPLYGLHKNQIILRPTLGLYSGQLKQHSDIRRRKNLKLMWRKNSITRKKKYVDHSGPYEMNF